MCDYLADFDDAQLITKPLAELFTGTVTTSQAALVEAQASKDNKEKVRTRAQ